MIETLSDAIDRRSPRLDLVAKPATRPGPMRIRPPYDRPFVAQMVLLLRWPSTRAHKGRLARPAERRCASCKSFLCSRLRAAERNLLLDNKLQSYLGGRRSRR